MLLINDLTVLSSYHLYSPVYPLQFGARDQDCVLAEYGGLVEQKISSATHGYDAARDWQSDGVRSQKIRLWNSHGQ